jgi:hypothetical protein
VLTQRAARIYEKRGALKILKVSIHTRMAPITIVTRTDAMLTPAASSLVEFLRAAAKIPDNEDWPP